MKPCCIVAVNLDYNVGSLLGIILTVVGLFAIILSLWKKSSEQSRGPHKRGAKVGIIR